MQKIPTLFVRDEASNRKHVRDEVAPGCEWVLAGDGEATRKFDGTCVRISHVRYDGPQLAVSVRREVKPGKPPPEFFEPVATDEVTGKTVGWVPYASSGFSAFLDEALGTDPPPEAADWPEGTYELCGPRINGNPEQFAIHQLVPHGFEPIEAPRDFDGLRAWLIAHRYEGIVWHHPDGRMAKLKRRDFPT